ncbi:hypothetical protein DMN91_004684 [Ooceraea biroi]|uniref:Uncharacterized protein n=1 Tax=Ooceraea biroi TaxID=2015173 RepID=A0A3L8DQ40_OOCBI|nr:hypothetical protein DMN91_004684 [Ooceraea biroi]
MTDDTSQESIFCQLFDCVLNSKTEWGLNGEESKSACPSRKKKPRKKCTEPNSKKIEEEVDIGPPCTEEEPCKLPSPKKASYCYIKMQDPYAPCCCEARPQLPPCPPKCHPRPSQRLICGCDLCKKRNIDNKCCGSTATFRRASDSSFEEA